MGPTTPARSRSPERRELRARGRATMRRLLDAGITVFAQRGYHTARVDDIVKVARTSHGTFYLYFSNKEDLFRALVEEVADEMSAHARALATLGDGRDDLRDWIQRLCELYRDHAAVIRAWTEAEISTDELGRLGESVLGDIADELAQHVRATAERDDAQLAAVAIVGMLERMNYYVITGRVEIEIGAMVDTLTDVTYRSLMDRRPAHSNR